LDETSSKCHPVHRVQKKIDAEVGVEKEHTKLLNAPERGRSSQFPQRVKQEYVQTDGVAVNKGIGKRDFYKERRRA
jgi:hypothetical protein